VKETADGDAPVATTGQKDGAGTPATDGGGQDGAAPKAPARRRRSRSGGTSATATSKDGAVDTAIAKDDAAKAADAGSTTKPRARRSSASKDTGEDADVGHGDGTPEGEPGAARPRRRRRRGGRGRGSATRAAGTSADGADDAPAVDARDEAGAHATAATADSAPDAGGEQKPRRRRRRSGAAAASGEAGGEVAAKERPAGKPAGRAAASSAPAAPPTRTRRRRGSAAEAESEPGAAESTRTRRRRLPGRRRREPTPVIRRAADKSMLITELEERDQIAVLQDRTLIEHYITRSGARSMVGNIYLGKVQNVLPGMEAAFIDVGRGRNAVLYAGEVSYDEEIDGHAPRIEHVLKTGKNVIVQVTKDPIGGKGARLTQEISLPGRFLVYVPNSETFGISRRLPDAERQRLKDILKSVRPKGHGLIVRTAADQASEADLRSDLERLVAEWDAIDKSAKRGKAPRVLYEEPELTIRVVRDLFTEGEFKEVITDSQRIYDLVRGYLSPVAPDLLERVHLHEGSLSLMDERHVTEQVHKALDRKVWLPSGGYIVIDRTEAMTVIDVNTGKHVSGANLEETVTKTNVEAAEEVARQLRLRDIGGMIIIDFIDMLLERNKDKVIQTLQAAMAEDKTRSQVFDQISPLGLVEVTRKRVSAGLLESFSHTCPECEGRGIIVDHRV
jgi:ribonuclease E